MRRVLHFLEVDELAPIEVVEANPTVAVRSLRLHRAVQAVQVGSGPVAEAVKASLKRSPRGGCATRGCARSGGAWCSARRRRPTRS